MDLTQWVWLSNWVSLLLVVCIFESEWNPFNSQTFTLTIIVCKPITFSWKTGWAETCALPSVQGFEE
jgi:hypothetical protein